MGERKLIELEMLESGRTVFRNDNGTAWVGGQVFQAKKDGVIPVKKGQTVVISPSRMTYGLNTGSGDLIGWTNVGGVAVFTSIEVKTENDSIGRDQILWHMAIIKAGGISKVVKEGVELTMPQILRLPRRAHKDADALDKAITRIYSAMHE